MRKLSKVKNRDQIRLAKQINKRNPEKTQILIRLYKKKLICVDTDIGV